MDERCADWRIYRFGGYIDSFVCFTINGNLGVSHKRKVWSHDMISDRIETTQ